MNIRRWRTAAGITQEGLGAALGWSAASVSAAERSADPARDRRRFDAQVLADLAGALDVPLMALFLPPPDDGTGARYVITTSAGREMGMSEWMDDAVMHDNGGKTPAREAWDEGFRAAMFRYLDPAWAADVARWMAADSPGKRADQAARLRAQAASVAAAAAEFASLADAIEARE